MTITVLPMDATAGAPAYTAQHARQAQAALYGNPTGRVFGTRSGWRVGTLSSIVSVTSTTWTLNPCACMIEPAAQLYQGAYGWASDQVISGPMTAADGTNPRIDILYIQVNDSSAGDGTGGLSANVSYLAGAPLPSGTQVAPALPPRSFLVATIAVPKSGGGSPTVTLNPTYFVAAGGVLPVATQAERDALTAYEGLTVERKDLNGILQTYSSSAWRSSIASDFGNGTNPPIIKSNTVTVSTDAAGNATVTFPTAFPTAMTACVISEATDPNTIGALVVKYNFVISDRTKFVARIYTAAGASYTSVSGIRLSYIATGY